MIVSLAGTAGAPVAEPDPGGGEHVHPAGGEQGVERQRGPAHLPGLQELDAWTGRPESPGAALSEKVAVSRAGGRVNDVHRAASDSIPATNAFAPEAAAN